MTWRDPSIYLNHIYIEESCAQLPYTQEILARTDLPYSIVAERNKPNNLALDYAANLTTGKRQLFLSTNRGHFFKPCPGTREYQCCDYQVIRSGEGCPIDCVYCILQAYLNSPWIVHYINIEKLFLELKEALTAHPEIFFRIGTGEFTDSLALDRITALSRQLVPFFKDKKNAVLELKTKSAVIENLKNLEHNGRTIIAWSLNSPQMMAQEELRSATLDERLQAAAQVAQWGYLLAFHFDPIIDHNGWQKGYRETIEKLYATIPAKAIAWISLGALRYIPKLKEVGTTRFPHSTIYYNEFVEGLDGKARYFRKKRVALYRYIYEILKKKATENTCIYFCMESDEIWQEVMGFTPKERGGLPAMLDRSVQEQQSNFL